MAFRMKRKDSLFLIVDVQEKLAPAMQDSEEVISANYKLLHAAAKMDVPVLVSEQYPQGIGSTVDDLKLLIEPDDVVEKMTFSCMETGVFQKSLEKKCRNQIIVGGMETHVCVLQTVLDLLATGYQVFVVEDAASSRTTKNKQLGLERMRQCGAQIVSSEMVMFEWLERAGTDMFKSMLPLIK